VNEMGEEVLKSSRRADDAVTLFINFFRENRLNTSANIIIADKNTAHLIELLPHTFHTSSCGNLCVATNHFTHFQQINHGLKTLKSSVQRLATAKKLLTGANTIFDVVEVLVYHDGTEKSICRLGEVMTSSSMTIGMGETLEAIYFPGPPCITPFVRVEWSPESLKH